MRLLAQNYGSGDLQLLDVPEPMPRSGHILVRTAASVVSLGTEKTMIDTARKSLLGKALARPDWVRQVLDKVRTEGLAEAYRQSKARLDMPVPLGYSSAGTVIGVGPGTTEYAEGDRVACSGSGYASHADIVCVPETLCAALPEHVSFAHAAYGALGAIALEAVRMADVRLGHRIAVIGLGLLGQLTAQILRAAGCHVLGIDISRDKCRLALELGAHAAAVYKDDDIADIARRFARGRGVDAAVIMAAAPNSEPLDLAAQIVGERGKVVATGLVELEIPRKAFYEKELELVVSRAWGPGADTARTFPFPYPRWTAQENLREFIAMLADGRVTAEKLTTHRFPFDRALTAYETLLKGEGHAIGVLLEYEQPQTEETPSLRKRVLREQRTPAASGDIGVGLIGAGMFARGTLLPAMRKLRGFRFVGVATAGGLSGAHAAEKFGFDYCTTDHEQLLKDDDIQAVFVLTRHGSHSRFVIEALNAGKAVFVEKPLAVTREQLDEIAAAYDQAPMPYVMVGFNRRFSPAAIRAKEFIGHDEASVLVNVRCNAGPLPADSWVYDPDEGGGRTVGEVCHFVDLVQYLTGSNPSRVFAASASGHDNLAVSVQMENGAAGSITYAGCGDKSFPRERVEIFAKGGVFLIDNFRETLAVVNGRRTRRKASAVDRGHRGELAAFLERLREGKEAPVCFADYVATTLTTLAIDESLSRRQAVQVSSIKPMTGSDL